MAPFGAFITYVPLRTEVPFRDYLTLPEGAAVYEIAPRASLDPSVEARRAMEAVGDTSAAMIIYPLSPNQVVAPDTVRAEAGMTDSSRLSRANGSASASAMRSNSPRLLFCDNHGTSRWTLSW